MIKLGDVVTVDFPGVSGLKRRPAVVISNEMYHHTRPDVILGLLTSQTVKATQPTDYTLQDWSQAGLRTSSAFRAFLTTLPASSVTLVGHLSQRDWQGVQSCLKKALAVN